MGPLAVMTIVETSKIIVLRLPLILNQTWQERLNSVLGV
jgi:hypothetical protein